MIASLRARPPTASSARRRLKKPARETFSGTHRVTLSTHGRAGAPPACDPRARGRCRPRSRRRDCSAAPPCRQRGSTRRGGGHADDRLGELGAAGAHQAADADHLAATNGETDIMDLLGGERLDDRALAGSPRALEQVAEVAADHQADDAFLVGVGGRSDIDQLAVAQHRDAVGELDDLVQPVGDVDHRHAIGAQPADNREQALRLVLGQRRGRLVEAISRPPARTERMISISWRCAGPRPSQSWRGRSSCSMPNWRRTATVLVREAPSRETAAPRGRSPRRCSRRPTATGRSPVPDG